MKLVLLLITAGAATFNNQEKQQLESNIASIASDIGAMKTRGTQMRNAIDIMKLKQTDMGTADKLRDTDIDEIIEEADRLRDGDISDIKTAVDSMKITLDEDVERASTLDQVVLEDVKKIKAALEGLGPEKLDEMEKAITALDDTKMAEMGTQLQVITSSLDEANEQRNLTDNKSFPAWSKIFSQSLRDVVDHGARYSGTLLSILRSKISSRGEVPRGPTYRRSSVSMPA